MITVSGIGNSILAALSSPLLPHSMDSDVIELYQALRSAPEEVSAVWHPLGFAYFKILRIGAASPGAYLA
jgi:hypothetical protein